jgi:hypothetical protein
MQSLPNRQQLLDQLQRLADGFRQLSDVGFRAAYSFDGTGEILMFVTGLPLDGTDEDTPRVRGVSTQEQLRDQQRLLALSNRGDLLLEQVICLGWSPSYLAFLKRQDPIYLWAAYLLTGLRSLNVHSFPGDDRHAWIDDYAVASQIAAEELVNAVLDLDASRTQGRGTGQQGSMVPPLAKRGKGRQHGTVNARMLETIQQDPSAMGWSSPKWAKQLKCSRSTIVATEAWRMLESARLRAKAERMTDRRRKPKASDQRRD